LFNTLIYITNTLFWALISTIEIAKNGALLQCQLSAVAWHYSPYRAARVSLFDSRKYLAMSTALKTVVPILLEDTNLVLW